MLSILIPTYNYDITKLAVDLHQQATEMEIDFEIIVMEDGSQKFTSNNQTINTLPGCHYYVLSNNIGRSAIRNKLADMAQYPYLLFIDCDAEVSHKDYLRRYITCCSGDDVVLIGGTSYDPAMNHPRYSLRLKYGRERESNLHYLINHQSKENFATFNFLISKSIFDKIRFDETIKGYGHEDTLFGHHLHEAGYVFRRIDNPLIHRGVDDNDVFIEKTAESVKNLYKLLMSGKYPFLADESKLLRYFSTLKRYHLTGIVAMKFFLIRKLLRKNLTGKNPSLILFDVFKLMLLCKYHVGADKMTDCVAD
ncbi:MAG: glycosyltransferase [Paludibacter sp.]|nr:glycosyltransferase [Paludibacter sp.]